MYKLFAFSFFCCLAFFSLKAQNSKYVNVFIGTKGTGHCFPGPSMPFGMVQPGPDNKDFGWDYTSGYQYDDSTIVGFSQTRFNGTGINEMGDVLLMPINPLQKNLANGYIKSTEKASTGLYKLTKKDGVSVALSCTERVAMHQYQFPSNEALVMVDLQHGLRFVFDENNQKSLVVQHNVTVENEHTISGYIATNNWVNRKYFFTLVFNQPFKVENIAKGGKAPVYKLFFQLNNNKTLLTKVALSSVSVEGAKLNMQTELPHWNFNAVVNANKNAWNKYLNKIDIVGSFKQKQIFYTSLYRLFLQPSNIADVDGRYRGVNDEIAKAPNKSYYSTLSIWDIYRGAFPLLQILAPEKIDDIINSMLIHHKAKGFLPIWTAWGQDNYCMIGNHAIPMILSAYQNGFKGFNANDALQAMVETSTISHINSNWELYNQYGYYPFDSLDNEAVSRTLESGYDDYCVAQMALKLSNKSLAASFEKRSNYFQNLFDTTTQFFRGKDSKGNWRTPFDPLMATSPLNNPGDYTEANAWQYFWTPAQFNINGLTQLLGGKKGLTTKLDAFFNTHAPNPNKFLGQEAMIGQYAHGNEPSHHVIYLYAYSQSPLKGQYYINKVINDFHNNTPDGMIGNDDCGQMSAWYILSTLGFYPVNPASGEFVLGSPQVKKALLYLNNQKVFQVNANGLSLKSIYNKKRFLNGKPITSKTIAYTDIMKGGKLTFNMTEK
ncbi:MAG: GH92 family glycosyl hydrolase [Chitinophagaceae bacterium]